MKEIDPEGEGVHASLAHPLDPPMLPTQTHLPTTVFVEVRHPFGFVTVMCYL